MTEKTIDFANNIRLRIEQDQDPEFPGDWVNLGEIAYSSSRTTLGTENMPRERLDEIRDRIACGELVGTPVYAYVHGGATISCGVQLKDKARTWTFCNPFSCPWDSGQSGFVYCTKERAIAEFGKKVLTKAVREKALQRLANEVAIFNQYLTDDVYGFIVERLIRDPHGKNNVIDTEELSSCWGFYGIEAAIADGTSDAEYYVRKEQNEAVEAEYWAQRGVLTVSNAHIFMEK
jgi:hypothetical protein